MAIVDLDHQENKIHDDVAKEYVDELIATAAALLPAPEEEEPEMFTTLVKVAAFF